MKINSNQKNSPTQLRKTPNNVSSENLFEQLPNITTRVGRSKNFKVNTYFIDPVKPIQVKGKRIPIHLLPKVKLCVDQFLKDGHIQKPTK